MTTLNINEIPAVRMRREFLSLLDYILPKINFWVAELDRLDTLDQQFDYVCMITEDPRIARDIFLLAKQFQKREPRFSFPMAMLWVYITGYNLEQNPETAGDKLAQSVGCWDSQDVAGAWGWIKKAAGSVYKGAKSVVKTVYKGGKAVVSTAAKGAKWVWEGTKKIASEALALTKSGVFWAIKAVFGKKIGGFITNAIELIVGSAAKMTFGMLWATVKSLSYLIRGKWKDAVNAIIGGINESIMTPILTPLAIAMKLNAKQFNRILKTASKKNKTLALQVVSLVFSGISGNVQAIITGAITIMRPIILALVKELKGSPKTMKAVDVGLSVILMIVQGVGSFNQIMDTIAAKLKIKGERALKLLKDNFRAAMKAISKFNFKDFIKYLLKGVSAPGMDQMKQAITTPSVSRLLTMKPAEVQRFMELSLKDEKGARAINRALKESRPAIIRTVIEHAARQNPRIITEVIRGSRAQGQILEALSQAA